MAKQVRRERSSKRTPGDPLCGGLKRNGEPCRKLAGFGTDHKGVGRCKFHSGASPNGERAAAKELAELARLELLAVTDLEEVDPADALMHSLHGAARLTIASKALLEYHIHTLPYNEGRVERAREIYETDLERQQKFAQSCIRLGIAERHVRMVERSGEQLLTMLRGLLDDLEIPMEKARPFLLKRLGSLGSGNVIEITETIDEEADDG